MMKKKKPLKKPKKTDGKPKKGDLWRPEGGKPLREIIWFMNDETHADRQRHGSK